MISTWTLASTVYKFFDKKTSGRGIKNENISNKELAEELHKSINRNFNKREVNSPFIDNIWGAALTDMQLISKFNEGFRFLLCVIDIYSKYALVIPLKEKKGITITNAFQYIESNKEINYKNHKFKIDDTVKIFLQKVTLHMDLKNFL